MSDFSKFRTAVSGFNRTDVVNYIESTSIEHQKALRKLTDERDKLAAENARLQVELAGLQKRLEQAQADNDALSGQVNALAQEGSDLAERIYAQLSNLCEDARTRYMDSGEEIAALAADLSTGLSRLQDAFAEVQVIFDDAQNAFDDMQLPETAAEETAE